MTALRFQGRNHAGIAVTGVIDTANHDLPAWVETRWRKGWPDLKVFDATDEWARICIDPISSKRIWWAAQP